LWKGHKSNPQEMRGGIHLSSKSLDPLGTSSRTGFRRAFKIARAAVKLHGGIMEWHLIASTSVMEPLTKKGWGNVWGGGGAGLRNVKKKRGKSR